MQHRPYGRTGLRPSSLGYGAMRLPHLEDGTCDFDAAVPLLQRGIDLGITYIDSAWSYINGTSEVAVGRAIRPYDRSKLILATKIPSNDIRGAEWRERLEIQLKRFDTPYVDIMHFHGLRWEAFEEHISREDGCLPAARQAQSEGLVRHLAFSSHDRPENILKLVETGEFDGVTLQYNVLDRSLEQVLQRAHARGMGTVIMGPVGGGRMALWSAEQMAKMWPKGVQSAPDLAIRWVLSHPFVTVALSGMNSLAMIDENVASASRPEPFTPAEVEAVEALLARLKAFGDLYCTGCGYCLPCPNGVDIPGNFLLMNYHRVYGMTGYARDRYAQLLKGETVWLHGPRIEGKAADACVQCGQCERKCPQNIPIIDQLEEVHRTLG